MTELFAHTSNVVSDKETLDEHSRAVARHARALAGKFGAGDLASAAGMLHDLGKAKQEFQAYLRGERGSYPHSADGALYAVRAIDGAKSPNASEKREIGRVLAFAIAGHHAGLANGSRQGGGTSPLLERLEQAWAEAVKPKPWFDPQELAFRDWPPKLPGRPSKTAETAFAWAFFTRMLFSALVDADFIETERWFADVERGETVARGWRGLAGQSRHSLRDALNARLAGFGESIRDIDHLRAEVLADCRAAAIANPTGHFTLTVPTGGGKTLSSLAFALDHAIKHDLDRVIYVIPFTSIVEQTATEFRKALKDNDAILEHHSAFDFEKLARDQEDHQDGEGQIRRAAENWDRPVIVTTAVQFFESLFANRPSRCRKLHNIARSVIVLDEAQTLPVPLLRPCLAALKELVRGYGSSVVYCTATQPALTKAAWPKPPAEFIDNVVEIIPHERNLFERLKRVRWRDGGTASDEDIASSMRETDAGLVIVNNRRHARELYERLNRESIEGAHHLTTAMTAAHRQHVLSEIRTHLDPIHPDHRPVRLVATSLIEAGVDISFKAVWRAWAGLDQIAQAAGRCNRNGELGPEGGKLTIFEPEPGEGRNPPRETQFNGKAAQRVISRNFDALSPAGTRAYFEELLSLHDDDGHWKAFDRVTVGEAQTRGIMSAIEETAGRLDFPFADIAQAFRIINDTMVPVIIPSSIDRYAVFNMMDMEYRIHAIAQRTSDRAQVGKGGLGGILRDLQRHIVQVPRRIRDVVLAEDIEFIARDAFENQFAVLRSEQLYSMDAGLKMDDPTYRSAESNLF